LPEEAHLLVVVQLFPDSLIFVTPAALEIEAVPIVVAVAAEQEALGLTEQMSHLEMVVQDICCHQNLEAGTLRVVVVVEMVSLIIR
jgi:hypothetical protein